MPRTVQPVAQLVYGLVVFLLGVSVRLFFNAERGEVEGARLNRRPINDHGHGAIELHIFHGPTGKVKRGSLSRDESSTLRIETRGSGRGDHFSDAARSRDRNVSTRRIHSGGRDQFRVVVAQFSDVE